MERRNVQQASLIVLVMAICLVFMIPPVFALQRKNEVVIAQLKYKGLEFEPYSTSLNMLAQYIVTRTSVSVGRERKLVSLDDKELFDYPMIYMAGAYDFKPFSDTQIKKLRAYLTFGGTLLIDDASGKKNSSFDKSVKRMLGRVFPSKKLSRLGDDHTIFQTFYMLKRIAGRKLVSAYLYGIDIGDITPVIYSRNDLGGALAGSDFGGWENECTPGGDRQREMSFRLGINIVMYALTANYKKDQVHIPFILKRRK